MGLKLMGCKLITSPSNLGGPVRAHRQHARELGAVRMRDGGRGSGAWARHRQRHTGEEAAAAHGRGGGARARWRRTGEAAAAAVCERAPIAGEGECFFIPRAQNGGRCGHLPFE
jgi:hypothetical protein